MKRTAGIIVLISFSILLGACGGGSSKNVTPPPVTSKIAHRVFATNAGPFTSNGLNCNGGRVCIIDADKDLLSGFIIAVGSGPTRMVGANGRTLVLNTITNSVSSIDNATENQLVTVTMPSFVDSIAILPSNATGYATVRNSNEVGIFDTGQVLDPTFVTGITAPNRLVMSHGGKTLLVFGDQSNKVDVIDTSAKTTTTLSGFDRPTFGVYSSDDSKAYILNCGPECGGSTASITVLDMTATPPAKGITIPVSAATVGLLDGTRLYIAGTAGSSGKLDVIDTTTTSVIKQGVPITAGFHNRMVLTSNSIVYIGAEKTCANVCLTFFNTGSLTATLGPANGDVTGIQPITGRNVVYVVEGTELDVYNTGSNTVVNGTNGQRLIDIVGPVGDVIEPK